MDAHINNRETFLTDAQFLNRLSKRVRLRFVVEINGDLQRSKLVTRWSFFFHLFSLFPSFLSPFLSLLSARFFFLFFLLARNGSRIHVFYQFDFLHCTKSPAFHHRAARDFTSREMSFSLFTRFFFFFFLRDRPHNYATLNVEPDRFAFQTDHLPFFRSDFAAHLVARFEGKRVPPLPFDFIEMDSKFLLTLNR